ncbi:type III polyketide synthase [Actinokineospora iranica]|uniref:Predicted naringenin-chalcone synthase n=1 Tax=Actinokineospora iranica TaxID=1271860 RepID=A0A1G6WHL8_9PSEU|nr:type III polyketide synthase [Actinokineospora iranica]SDD65311.1 Predicted naringenin-chalcone synthase [Actinokineospora iranica]
MSVVTGIGVALPRSVGQDVLWEQYFRRHFGDSALARRVFAGAGVRSRNSVVDPVAEDVSGWSTGERMARFAEEAPPLAVRALTNALADAGMAADELGLLTVVSCTGYGTPGLDIGLAAALDLPADTQRLVIGHMGCHAALPGLRSVSDFVAASGQPAALVCVELTSLHVQPPSKDPEQMVAHSLFSDAAAAVVVRPSGPGWAVVDVAAHTEADSRELMTWTVTDQGFRMGLSARVPEVFAASVRPAVEKLLARHGAEIGDVAGWAVHPGGPRILDTVQAALDLPAAALEPSRAVLAAHGNCSSATVLLVLRELSARPGELVVALAFGPGLTLYTVLLRGTA